MKIINLAILILLVPVLLYSQQNYNAKEYLSQVGIAGLSISPQGKYIIAVTSQLDFEEDNTAYELWRFTVTENNKVGVKLLLDNNLTSYSSFKWSSDGNYLYFLGGTKDGSKLFQQHMAGGSPLPLKLSSKGKLSGFEMLANDQLLLRMSITEEIKDAVKMIYGDAKRVDYAAPVSYAFYNYDPATQKSDSLFSLNGRIAGTELSPDKSKLLIAHSPPFTGYYDYPNHISQNELAVYDAQSGKKIKQLTNNRSWEDATWKSNNDLFLQIWNNEPNDPIIDLPKMQVVSLAKGEGNVIHQDFPGRINQVTTITGGDALFTANVSTTNNFYLLKNGADTYTPVSNFKGNVTNYSYSKETGAIVFSLARATDFEAIYFATDVKSIDKAVRVADFNESIGKKPKPVVTKYEWKNSDGELIEGILIWPPGKEGASDLPFAVDIHGGPWSLRHEQLSLTGLQYYYYGSLLASNGFLVLQPNYTGGVGRGDKFMNDINGRPLTKPEDDILKGVESLKEKGWINEDKMLVMGASYGGLLTNGLIGSSQDFDLALSSCGIWDETLGYLSDGNALDHIVFEERKFWEHRDYYWQESAISRIDNIKTPTLITFGEKDVRVPVANGYSMYRMLMDKGVPVELVFLPGEGHIYRKPSNMFTKMKIELHWIEQYLGIEIPVE